MIFVQYRLIMNVTIPGQTVTFCVLFVCLVQFEFLKLSDNLCLRSTYSQQIWLLTLYVELCLPYIVVSHSLKLLLLSVKINVV